MRKIQSLISTASADFRRNEARNRDLVAQFRERQERARHVRPKRDLDRLASQGKMRPRERIEKLLDPGTPFLELSSLAANMAYDGESPSASSIVGIGIVSGREVIVRADDPRRAIVTCAGAPACASGEMATRDLAATIAAAAAPLLDGSIRLHLSGCPKGCAHPLPAALTVVGRGGACGLVFDGSAPEPPAAVITPQALTALLADLAGRTQQTATEQRGAARLAAAIGLVRHPQARHG